MCILQFANDAKFADNRNRGIPKVDVVPPLHLPINTDSSAHLEERNVTINDVHIIKGIYF